MRATFINAFKMFYSNENEERWHGERMLKAVWGADAGGHVCGQNRGHIVNHYG